MTPFDVKFIKPFLEGTVETLKVQCSVEASPTKPFVLGKNPLPDMELAGVITISSKTFSGCIILAFPEAVFLSLMNNMLGETYTSISEDLQSGAAELLNIVYGKAKVVLNEQGYTIDRAIPNVVRGKDKLLAQFQRQDAVLLPFKSNVGEFHMEILVEKKVAA